MVNAEMTTAVQDINTQIIDLAQVLNTQSVANGVTTESNTGEIPVDTMVKRYKGDTYIFAVSMRPGDTIATFTLRDFFDTLPVTVVGEGRELTSVEGVFIDNFSNHAVHIYKIETNR